MHGFGPWFCGLYCSLSSSSKKARTDVRLHTHPLLLEKCMNQGKKQATDGWVLLMVIGYFESHEAALSFYSAWAKTKQVQQGLELYIEWQQRIPLRIWCTSFHKGDAIEQFHGYDLPQPPQIEELRVADVMKMVARRKQK